jgi:hypothetical protein
MPNNDFEQALQSGANVKKAVQFLNKNKDYILSADAKNSPLVASIINLGESAKKGDLTKAENYLKLTQAIITACSHEEPRIKIQIPKLVTKGKSSAEIETLETEIRAAKYAQMSADSEMIGIAGKSLQSKGHSLISQGTGGPNGATALQALVEFGCDPALPKNIREQIQKMANDFIAKHVDPIQKNSQGQTFAEALSPDIKNENINWLAKSLLNQLVNGERGLWASQALASLNQKYPAMVSEVLSSNTKLLNSLGKGDSDSTPLMKMALFLKLDRVSNPEACFKLLTDMVNTKGVNLNVKSKETSNTVYSTILDSASTTSPKAASSVPYFQQLAVALEDKKALDGKPQRRENLRLYDTSWRTTYDPSRNAPKTSTSAPLPLMPVLTVSPTVIPDAPMISRQPSQLNEKNLNKVRDTLKQSSWEVEAGNKSANVTNSKNNESFKILPDKLTTHSTSKDTYVAMLKAFQKIHPDKLPKINLSDKNAEANARLACSEVYKEKGASIKIILSSQALAKKQEKNQAPEQEEHSAKRLR